MHRFPVGTGTKTATRFCSLPRRAGTGLHRVALAISQHKKLVLARQNKRVDGRYGHWFFGNIHPYLDGNGYMARILLNLTLALNGCPLERD
jgi:fido (protein-threonine AMPylation protein)